MPIGLKRRKCAIFFLDIQSVLYFAMLIKANILTLPVPNIFTKIQIAITRFYTLFLSFLASSEVGTYIGDTP